MLNSLEISNSVARAKILQEIFFLLDSSPVKQGDKIRKKLKSDEFNSAFLQACMSCKVEDKVTFKIIKLLVSNANLFGIDINYKDADNLDAMIYAAVNVNADLIYYLNYRSKAENLFAYNIFWKNRQQISSLMDAFYQKSFSTTLDSLCKIYSNGEILPPRKQFKEDGENAKFDSYRVSFICNALEFLHTYQTLGSQLIININNLTPTYSSILQLNHLARCRLILEMVSQTIKNLSAATRIKHHKSLSPAPFTWITLEQLGGFIKAPPAEASIYISMSTFLKDADLLIMERTERLLNEATMHQDIIEEAIPDIIKNDVPNLIIFFKEIGKELRENTGTPAKVVNLPVIKAMTGYVSDLLSLVKLINITSLAEKSSISVSERALVLSPLTLQQADLSTKLGKHAILRLIENIGELLTGKNFSSFLMTLDDSIDWRAFITWRDTIVHQDEGDNKYKIDCLLNDANIMEKILTEDFKYFWSKLFKLLASREAKIGIYEDNAEEFWPNILKFKLDTAEDNDSLAAKPVIQRRTTLELEEKFIQALTETQTPEHLIKLCQAVFAGMAEVPNNMVKGEIFRCLPAKKADKKRYDSLVQIYQDACGKKLSEIERMEARRKAQLEKEKRLEERNNRLKGLDTIRMVAKRFSEVPDLSHVLNFNKRLQAVIDAIENIKEFLTDEGYLIEAFSFDTVEKWDNYHLQLGGLGLSKLLEIHPKLSNALEYNAAQALQHLEKTKECKEFKQLNPPGYIINYYHELRNFRNYLEHGDPLIDFQNGLVQQGIIKDLREKIVSPMLLNLVYKVLPELRQLQLKLFKKESREWEFACTNSLNFFNSGTKDSQEANQRVKDFDLSK